LKKVQALAKERNATRFLRVPQFDRWRNTEVMSAELDECTDVWYLDMSHDHVVWKPVLEEAEMRMAERATANWNLTLVDSVYTRIKELVPWEVSRIQIARNPKARRLPTDFPYLHRATVALKTNGEIFVESEPIEKVSFPRTRFVDPVKIAIFIFGTAPESPERPKDGSDDDQDVDFRVPCHPKSFKHGDELWFEGIDSKQCPRSIRVIIARMHMNLGHPSNPELIKLLLLDGASAQSLAAASALRCGPCLRKKASGRPRPTTMPRFGQFGDRCYCDVVFCTRADGAIRMFLGIIDRAIHYHLARLLVSREPKVALKLLMDMWLTPLGIPVRIIMDRDGAFGGEFTDHLEAIGCELEIAPADGHHQMGLIERHNHTWRSMLEKVVDTLAIITDEYLDLAAVQVNNAKNMLVRRCGRSPVMALFGRMPRVPGILLTDEANAHTFANISQNERLYISDLCRVESIKAFAEVEASSALKESVNNQASYVSHTYSPGDPVMFWRSQSRRGLKRRPGDKNSTSRPGFLKGTFVCQQPSESGMHNFQIWHNGRVYLCVPTQCRPAFGFETWTPSAEDLSNLKSAEAAIRKGDPVVDAREPDHPIESTSDPPVYLDPDGRPDVSDDGLAVPPSAVTAPLSELSTTGGMELDHIPGSQRVSTFSISPPSVELEFPTPQFPPVSLSPESHVPMVQDSPPVQDSPLVQDSPMVQDSSRVVQDSPHAVQDSPHAVQDSSQTRQDTIHVQPFRQKRDKLVAPGTPPLQAALKEPRIGLERTSPRVRIQEPEALTCDLFPGIFDLAKSDGFDGSEAAPYPFVGLGGFSDLQHVTCHPSEFNSYQTHFVDAVGSDSDVSENEFFNTHKNSIPYEARNQVLNSLYTCCPSDSDLMCLATFLDDESTQCPSSVYDPSEADCYLTDDEDPDDDLKPLSRAQRKQLDREIPWREIIARGNEYTQEFVKAADKEGTAWDKYQSIRAVPDPEAKRILSDAATRKFALRSRAAYRDKNCGKPPLHAKCRVVALGCNDPRLGERQRNSPTATRAAFMIMLQYISSCFLLSQGWMMAVADASAAFLQGKQPNRREKLYLRPPSDPIINQTKWFKHMLYEIIGSVYGLVDAPWMWCQEVLERMLGLEFVTHSLDTMLFIKRQLVDGTYQITCLVLFHVDDALIGWNKHFDIESLKTTFEWGTWKEGPDWLYWNGRSILYEPDTGNFKVSQFHAAQELEVKSLTPEQKKDPQGSLSASGRTELRSGIGSLQHLCSNSRADLSAPTSLAQRGQFTNDELGAVYQLMQYARETASAYILIVPVPLLSMCCLGFGDSSFANARDLKTQVGFLVFMTSLSVLTELAPGSLMDWKSTRTPRAVRSTLAAEATACDACTDHVFYYAAFMIELVHNVSVLSVGIDKVKDYIPCYVCTDCRSLYDAFHQVTPNLEEKRTIIDVLSIRQTLSEKGLRWLPTTHQLADGMTKIDKKLMAIILSVMQGAQLRLTDET